mgnify:CR=1 FL=1
MNKYESLCDLNKIELNYKEVKLKTHHREKIVRFELFYMANIYQIYKVLKERKYRHSSYHIFLIKIPKYRIVMSESISDKIVNHLISNEILLPLIEPKLIETNIATRKNKGIKFGINYVKKYINHLKLKYNNFYILKCDIKKYFYNVDHEILLEKLSLVIKDQEILEIITNIISTTNQKENNEQIKKLVEKEKERLLKLNVKSIEKKIKELESIPLYENGKGLPIGNMTSQIFAIFYLNELDHFIKEKLHIKYYIRYMDDFILMHPDREYLKYCLKEIEKELAKVKLSLNKKTHIFSIKQGLNFMGFRFILKGKRLIVLLNNQTRKRITKKLNSLSKMKKDEHYNSVLASYYGYFLNADCKAFLKSHSWYENKKYKK